jgi:hypothetical protein
MLNETFSTLSHYKLWREREREEEEEGREGHESKGKTLLRWAEDKSRSIHMRKKPEEKCAGGELKVQELFLL